MWLAFAMTAMTAAAAVRSQDEVGCLEEPEELDLEIRLALGDDLVERLDLFARLSGVGPYELTLRVTDQGRLLWSRVTELEPEDCALVPSLVARSLESGLAALPAWQLESSLERHHTELALLVTGTLPSAARIGGGGRVLGPLTGPLWWGAELEGSWSLVEHHDSGDLQIAAPFFATGPSLRLPARRDAVQVHARFAVGPAVVVGRGFLDDHVRVAPRAAVSGESVFASRTGLRVGIRGEIPVVRLVAVFPDTGERAPEALFRAGVLFGFGQPVGRGDGAPADRR